MKHTKSKTELFFKYNDSLNRELRLLADDPNFENVVKILKKAKNRKRAVYLCGNGGSAANANHFATDLLFGLNKNLGSSWRVFALSSNPSLLTCLGNDIGYEKIFSKQLESCGRAFDLLIVYSGSGNSANILNALKTARKLKMRSIAFVGFEGGKAKKLADFCLHFPVHDMQISEDLHMITSHLLLRLL